jgi:molybdopterin-biosynthesis enzyme MoeA-like protein
MAWPMMEWVLDTYYAPYFNKNNYAEQSVIVEGSMEATLTPLMEKIEADFVGIKVFSLPSVDHPKYGRHIELGVKGAPELVKNAYSALIAGLKLLNSTLLDELKR